MYIIHVFCGCVCTLSLSATNKSYCQVCVCGCVCSELILRKKGCNVQPQAAQSGCCAWHLGPLSLCRNWRGAGSFSKSQVLFYLSESTSDLSRRTPWRDLAQRAVCFPSLLFCHIPPSEGWDLKPSAGSVSRLSGKQTNRSLYLLFNYGNVWFLKHQPKYECPPSR